MTPQQIFATALRLFALWLAVSSVKYLFSIPAALQKFGEGDRLAWTYAAGAAYLLLAAGIWLFPMWLAHRIVPRTQFDNRLNLQPLEAARVGCALLGLWLFANAVLDLVYYGISSMVIYTPGSAFANLTAANKVSLGAAAVEFLFGLVLMLRAARFAKWVAG